MVQEAPIHQSHVYGRIKILRTIFEKGQPRNIPVKWLQNRTSGSREDFLKNCLKNSISLPWQPEFFDGIKLCEQLFEDLPRIIPAKFGPNWPSGLGGDVFDDARPA